MRHPVPTPEARRPGGYSTLQIALHWSIAGLVLAQFLTGEAMGEFFDRMLETEQAVNGQQASLGGAALAHFVMGALILALVVVRTFVRMMHGAPAPTPESPGWDRTLSRATHIALYGLLWITPILGAAAYLMGSEQAGDAHLLAKTALLVLVVLHIAGALFHQFFLRDHLIARMMRGSTQPR